MNLNELAVRISKIEGGKQQVNIAQIKEIIKAFSIIFWEADDDELNALINLLNTNGRKHWNKTQKRG